LFKLKYQIVKNTSAMPGQRGITLALIRLARARKKPQNKEVENETIIHKIQSKRIPDT
jgi:hypothetical protein